MGNGRQARLGHPGGLMFGSLGSTRMPELFRCDWLLQFILFPPSGGFRSKSVMTGRGAAC